MCAHAQHLRAASAPCIARPFLFRLKRTADRVVARNRVILVRRWEAWRYALAIVQPATVVRWHREGFKRFWTRRSRAGRVGRPALGRELIGLIRKMSRSNVTRRHRRPKPSASASTATPTRCPGGSRTSRSSVRANDELVAIYLETQRVSVHQRCWDIGQDVKDAHEVGLRSESPAPPWPARRRS